MRVYGRELVLLRVWRQCITLRHFRKYECATHMLFEFIQ